MKFVHRAKDLMDTAKSGGERALNGAREAAQNIRGSHAKIADHADTIAKGTRVAAGVAVVGASVAAPTGVAAAGVWLGIVSAPLIVTAAPILVGIAGAALTVSAGASLYSKAQRSKSTRITQSETAESIPATPARGDV
jgi:hypothetical protein